MYDAMAESVFNSWKYYRLDLEIVLIDSRLWLLVFTADDKVLVHCLDL